MGSPYNRTIDTPSGRVYIDPNTGTPTEVVPAGALTPTGKWVPLLADENGVLFVETGGQAGMPHFDDAEATVTPGTEQTLISQTVPVGISRGINQAFIVTRVTGVYTILADGQVIGSGRTGPGGTGPMSFNPPRQMSAGVSYQVIFKSRANAPAQGIECYVQSTDISQ